MKTFSQFLESNVKDLAQLKRKPLNLRTDKDQAFINAYSPKKVKPPVVTVELEYEDGTKVKEKFKIEKRNPDIEKESQEIAQWHLENMQKMFDRFPNLPGAKRAKSIHKVSVK